MPIPSPNQKKPSQTVHLNRYPRKRQSKAIFTTMTVKTHLKLVILFLLILACFTHRCKSLCRFSSSENLRDGEIKGMFVFGSSLVDNGNNNFLDTKAKADYLPYGIDFPNGASGRFTNGKNVVDLLGEQLKLPSLIPPFMDPATKGSRIVEGVNHASGSAGVLDDTGSVAVSQNHSSFYFLSLSSSLSSLNVLYCSLSLLHFLFFSPYQA